MKDVNGPISNNLFGRDLQSPNLDENTKENDPRLKTPDGKDPLHVFKYPTAIQNLS